MRAVALRRIVVTITILGLGVLAFYLVAKYLPVFPEEDEHDAA